MADLALQFGGDLAVSATGDLSVAGGAALTQQRVLLRLLTNPGDYIWHLTYGAGLGQFVGQPGAPAAITGVTRTQILRETSVAKSPAPALNTVIGDDGTVTLTVSYIETNTGQTSVLTFNL